METALDAFELPHIFARADGDPEAVLTLTLTLTLTLNVEFPRLLQERELQQLLFQGSEAEQKVRTRRVQQPWG